ncbi:translation initiation factor eIF-1A [Candidatus Woesearchaeota archaeon]|nr:translation initiation factor eIF-1A [Candidatus Woesearchaeota archaeon]
MGKKEREEQARKDAIEEEIRRVKLPRGIQTLGILDARLGGSRSRVRCLDGKTRVCRIPGRLKRRLWVREGDIVLIEPWELNPEDRGDILFKYSKAQVQLLKRKGYLEKLDEFDEF